MLELLLNCVRFGLDLTEDSMTTPTPDLCSLIDFIKKRLPFNKENYPAFDPERETTTSFAVRHILFHMMKSAGVIAAQSETVDHGGSMDSELLKKATTKMFVNALRLAEELRMTPEEIAEMVVEVTTIS